MKLPWVHSSRTICSRGFWWSELNRMNSLASFSYQRSVRTFVLQGVGGNCREQHHLFLQDVEMPRKLGNKKSFWTLSCDLVRLLGVNYVPLFHIFRLKDVVHLFPTFLWLENGFWKQPFSFLLSYRSTPGSTSNTRSDLALTGYPVLSFENQYPPNSTKKKNQTKKTTHQKTTQQKKPKKPPSYYVKENQWP